MRGAGEQPLEGPPVVPRVLGEAPHVAGILRVAVVQLPAKAARHRQPLGVGVDQMHGAARRLHRSPHQIGVHPRVHRQAAGVRFVDHELQRVERRIVGKTLRARLQAGCVEGIPTAANLHQQRVEAAVSRRRHHRLHSLGAAERGADHPERAYLVELAQGGGVHAGRSGARQRHGHQRRDQQRGRSRDADHDAERRVSRHPPTRSCRRPHRRCRLRPPRSSGPARAATPARACRRRSARR